MKDFENSDTTNELNEDCFISDFYSDQFKYVSISTACDFQTCLICRQFEGKFFLRSEAPRLPLCPNCSCAYMYYTEYDLPEGAIIRNKNEFVLPAGCVKSVYKNQRLFRETSDIEQKISLCEEDLKNLKELMKPYVSANFPVPRDLNCRDLLPTLYMHLGRWDDAERVIKACIKAKAYYPKDGSEQQKEFESYRKVASEALLYISKNPGCLQRNVYKSLPYEGVQRDQLKNFLRYSNQIIKEKSGSTNKLYLNL